MKNNCLCNNGNLTMMSAEEIRAHIRKLENELTTRENAKKEVAWNNFKKALAEYLEVFEELSVVDDWDGESVCVARHNVDLSEMGVIRTK